MLFQIKNNRANAIHPQLSRVWIKTGNPRMPLKGVWSTVAALQCGGRHVRAAGRQNATRDLAEDHLVLA